MLCTHISGKFNARSPFIYVSYPGCVYCYCKSCTWGQTECLYPLNRTKQGVKFYLCQAWSPFSKSSFTLATALDKLIWRRNHFFVFLQALVPIRYPYNPHGPLSLKYLSLPPNFLEVGMLAADPDVLEWWRHSVSQSLLTMWKDLVMVMVMLMLMVCADGKHLDQCL